MAEWFRFYNEALDNPKVQKLSPKLFKGWVNILCLAARKNGELPSLDGIAFGLRLPGTEAKGLVARLCSAGLLDEIETGFTPHDWASRQYKSDVSTGATTGSDSYVYFIGTAWDAPVKIGFSKNPWARLTEFQTGNSEKLIVLGTVRCKANSEIDIHDVLGKFRRKTGEWFDFPVSVANYVADYVATKKGTYEELVVALRRTTTDTDTETETETETERKKERGGEKISPANGGYAFEGKVIHLTKPDFVRWRKAYSYLPDIGATLTTADDYYAENPPKDGKWFFPVSRWLAKENDRCKAEAPDDPFEGAI